MTNEDKILELLMDMQKNIVELKTDVSGIKSDLANMKGQLDENTGMIRALTDATEVVSAKMDGLEVTTAKAESVVHMHNKIDLLDSKCGILNNRLFEQEAKMNVLRLVK